MITTVSIKQQQLKTGYFKTGSGPDHVFIMGSCRVVNYVNYFAAMPQFTVYSIDPFNWNWNENDDRVDYLEAISRQERNDDLLTMFKNCSIFIHEWYENAGMFNIKNIYSYGLKPEIDICIPNFNDLFILFKDIITFDTRLRAMAAQDFNVVGKLSEQTEQEIMNVRGYNITKFYEVCHLSSMPEFAGYFMSLFTTNRFFWTYNHVTKLFTLSIFDIINRRWFDNKLTVDRDHEDIFANNYTRLTEYDKKHGINWPEAAINLAL